jgi:hypothetical protein
MRQIGDQGGKVIKKLAPRKYTPEYMRNGFVDQTTRQAQRRMAPHLKPVDAMLILWAPEARYDGAPRLPSETILKKLIEEGSMGAGHHRGSAPQLPREFHIEFTDWSVSLMPETNRRVIFAEYVHFPSWPAERKARSIGMATTAWDKNLHEGRTIIWTLLRGFGFIPLENKV